MKKNSPLILSLIFIYTNGLALSIAPYLNKSNNQLQHQRHPKVGIVIANTSGKTIYSIHKQQYFSSASIMKIFTASAAILSLGPNYRFTTNLLATGKIKSGRLDGNLFLRFSGDPSLTQHDLRSLFLKLKNRGINRINGNVYLDNHRFDQISYAPGTTVDDLAYSYASPINAIIVDENAFNINIIPGETGQHPRIQSTLPANIVSLSNQIVSTQQYQQNCPLIITSHSNNHYLLTGCISRKSGKSTQTLAIRNIAQATEIEIQQLLRQNKISLKGHITIGRTPKKTTVIAMHFSPPLSLLIKKMLKESDNLISNDLIKTICYQRLHIPGNFHQGIIMMKQIISKFAQINLDNSRISDGAGLSRYNLITPNQVAKLLIAITHNSTLKRTIIPALPIAGKDGTLEDRMKPLAKKQRLLAKTGTLSGVSNIAGYLDTKHHGRLIAAFLINQFPSKVAPIRKWTDGVLTHLALY